MIGWIEDFRLALRGLAASPTLTASAALRSCSA
jgi:hypothetical protein